MDEIDISIANGQDRSAKPNVSLDTINEVIDDELT
jgi:hypothetical protein